MAIDSVAPAGIPAPGRSTSRKPATSGVPPQGPISAERLREVLDRLKTSFYDRPEVQDRIARSLSKDLGSQPME